MRKVENVVFLSIFERCCPRSMFPSYIKQGPNGVSGVSTLM